MRITIECAGVTSTVEDVNMVDLTGACTLIEQALKGCGFCFGGVVDIVDEEVSNEPK